VTPHIRRLRAEKNSLAFSDIGDFCEHRFIADAHCRAIAFAKDLQNEKIRNRLRDAQTGSDGVAVLP